MIIVQPSEKKRKRLQAVFPNGESIHFGSKSGQTFVDHQDETKKKNWIARHSALPNTDWSISGYMTPSWWSRYVLWNEHSIDESLRDVANQLNTTISYKKK